MSKKDSKLARDAKTGRFIKVDKAKTNPSTTVIEKIKRR